MYAILPEDAADIVSIAVGEGTALFLATLSTALLFLGRRWENSDENARLYGIELLSDVYKWLYYFVLQAGFHETLYWDGHLIGTSVESALLGMLAGVSAQIFEDILYLLNDSHQRHSKLGWGIVYVLCGLSGAALFTVYDSVQEPIRNKWVEFASDFQSSELVTSFLLG